MPIDSRVLVVLFAAAIFTSVIGSAEAQTFDVNVKLLEDPLTTCPTITRDEVPLNEDDISISVTNLDTAANSYELVLQLPQGWTGFPTSIQGNIITLAPGETGTFEILWITVPDVEPGIYELTAKVTSGTGQALSEQFDVEILSCHALGMALRSDGLQSVCSENPGKIEFSFDATNYGKITETFDFFAVSDATIVTWALFSSDSLTLEPGETERVTVEFSPPAELSGDIPIQLIGISRFSYAKDSLSVDLSLEDCFKFQAELEPQSATTCLGNPATYSLAITNTGDNNDEYTFSSAPFVRFSSDFVSIPAGDTKTIYVNAVPTNPGTTSFDINVYPSNDPLNSQKTTATLETRECRGVAIVTSTAEMSVCKGETASSSFVVKNTGTTEETFDISATVGTLESNKVILQPQEIRSMDIEIDTTELQDSSEIVVTARSSTGQVSDHGSFTLNVEDCYEASIAISPEKQEACQQEEVAYSVAVANRGEMTDSYMLVFGDQRIELDLDAGDSKVFEFVLPVEFESEGDYRIIAGVSSAQINEVAEALLFVKPTDECFSVGLEPGDEVISIEPVEGGKTIPIALRNTGESGATYKLSIEGPEWAYLEPLSISLEPGESKDAFLYVSPFFDTEPGEYKIKVTADSDFASTEKEFVVSVGQAEGNDGNVVIDGNEGSGFGDIFGGLSGITGALFSGDKAPTRLLIVGLIAVIIIVVLIVRFVMLFR